MATGMPAQQAIGQAFRIFVGLSFNAGKRHALFFGFYDACRLAIDIEHVIGKSVAGFQRKLANGNTACRADIGICSVAQMPTGCGKQAIDVPPGLKL